jgi:hypothetical protein
LFELYDQIGEIAKELSLKEFPSIDSRAVESKNIQVNEFSFEEFMICYDQIFSGASTILQLLSVFLDQLESYCL